NLNLADVAYTLQVGRAEFNHRLAVAVKNNLKEAIKGLKNSFSLGQASDSVKDLEKVNQATKQAQTTQDLTRLSSFWLQGARVDWLSLYQNERRLRIPLPTYPFERQRYWPEENKIIDSQFLLKSVETERAEQISEKIFYQPVWRETEKVYKGIMMEQGSVLIVSHQNDFCLAKRIAKYYVGKKIGVKQIILGNRFKKLSSDIFEIDFKDQKDYEKAWRRLSPVSAIYHLGGLQLNDKPEVESESELKKVQDYGAGSLLKLMKAVGPSGLKKGCSGADFLELKILTNNLNYLSNSDSIANLYPYSSSIVGLAKAIARENPSIIVSCIDIKREELESRKSRNAFRFDLLVDPAFELSGSELSIRGSQTYVKRIESVDLLKDNNQKAVALKRGGTYLIIGGTGNLGFETAKHFAVEAKANIVLVGRKNQNKEIDGKLAEIEKLGGHGSYFQADVARTSAMRGALSFTKEKYGEINGIIHAAGEMNEGSFENTKESQSDKVFQSKVSGCFSLYKAIIEKQKEPLDFLLFYSSVVSLIGSVGRSNYVAASSFEDNFALYLKYAKGLPVKIINWGYWGHNKDAFLGGYSICCQDGIGALGRVLSAKINQVMVAEIDLEKQKQTILFNILQLALFRLSLLQRCSGLGSQKLIERQQKMSRNFSLFASQSLLRVFQRLGLFKVAREKYNKASIIKKIGIIPEYYRLLDALLYIFVKGGYLKEKSDIFFTTDKVCVQEAAKGKIKEEEIRLVKNNPAALRFFLSCLEGYPEVLTGKKIATEIIFNQGRTKLLDNFYKEGKTAKEQFRFIGKVLKHYLVEIIRQFPEKKIEILEIGSGTGATSSTILEGIKSKKNKINFCLTDISKELIGQAKKRFSQKYRFVDYRILDIEKDLVGQGFNCPAFDIVLASNIIHATKNIGKSLNQINGLLKPGGLLIINENTDFNEYATMTFGLTKGWWLYEDEENRIKYSPNLTAAKWQELLIANGYDHINLLGLNRGSGQKVILAVNKTQTSNLLFKTKNNQRTSISSVFRPRPEMLTPYAPAETEIQKQLAIVWEEVLGIKDIGINDNFFEIGGNSLNVIQVKSKIKHIINKDIAIRDIFRDPTIKELAKKINEEKDRVFNQNNTKLLKQKKYYNLSRSQVEFWRFNKAEKNPLLNESLLLKLTGNLNAELFSKALKEVINRHESLRTNFKEIDNEPMQIIRRSAKEDFFKIIDLTNKKHNKKNNLNLIIKGIIEHKFKLESGNLFRLVLIKLKNKESFLIFVFHHLIIDLWSLDIFFRELSVLYNAFTEKRLSPLKPLLIQYKDYANYENSAESKIILESQEKYWLDQFKDGFPIVELPVDKAMGANKKNLVNKESIEINKIAIKKIAQFCGERNVTLFAFMFSVFSVFLYKTTKQRDLIIKTPCTNRNSEELQSLIGLFITIIALRSNLRGKLSFIEALAESNKTVIDGLANSNYSYSRLIEKLKKPIDDKKRSSEIFFQLASKNRINFKLNGIDIDHLPVYPEHNKFDLKCAIVEQEDRMIISFFYNKNLFKQKTIKKWLSQYGKLLERVISHPTVKISNL
ncbi:MAG TPA: L-histidine N(alpha)-methyltransferase, partial [Candidatus Portnoybacteria bacterium]|nr:L-histidine N(alpha)-methyltransferase [Candidatus Portnoybacteria bacterium]